MKNIIVTGATGAIGKAAAAEFAKENDVQLILAGRNMQKLQQVKTELQSKNKNAKIDLIEMDLGNSDSVKNAAAKVKQNYPNIHGLVNVAAVYKREKTLNSKGQETMFATNHLGPFLFTNLVLDNIKNTPNAKVLTVSAPSTSAVDFQNLNGEKKFSALGAFGASKMMNLMFAFKLAKEFKQGTQASLAFHPGLVKSELLNEGPKLLSGFLKLVSSSPEKTASAIKQLVINKDAASVNGGFFDKNLKSLKPHARSQDSAVQDQLWKESLRLGGL